MDELDLLRLTRPAVEPPAADAVGRIKSAALGSPVGAPRPADDALELDLATIESDGRRRRPARWRLAAAGVAATVIVTAGLGVVLRPGGGSGAGGPIDDASLRASLEGTWTQPFSTSGNPTTWGGLGITFQAAAGGAISIDGPCGPFVSRSYQVVDARLVLAEPLTSPEGGCTDPAVNRVITDLRAALAARPALAVAGDRLSIDGAGEFAPRGGPPTPTTRTTTVAGPPDPMLEELRGRTFLLAVLRVQERAVDVERPIIVTFSATAGSGFVCNVGQWGFVVDHGHLVLTAEQITNAACEGAPDVVALLHDRPTISVSGERLLLTSPDRTAELTEVHPGTPTTTTSIGFAPPSITDQTPRLVGPDGTGELFVGG